MTEKEFARAEAMYLDEDLHRGRPAYRCSVCNEESGTPICEECQRDSATAVSTMKSMFEEVNKLIK